MERRDCSAVALWVFPTGGFYTRGGKAPQLTVLEKKMVRRRRGGSPLLLLLFSNTKPKKCTDSRLGPRKPRTTRQLAAGAAFSRRPTILFCHKHTHTCKVCGRHPGSDTHGYDMFTWIFSFFFVQQYQRGARQKRFTPREKNE